MSNKTLIFEDFVDKVGEVFVISEQDVPATRLTLTEAQPLSPTMALRGVRPPFSLIFVAKDSRVLPQRIYRMEHSGLGELSIFVVPVGKGADGVTYQAMFN